MQKLTSTISSLFPPPKIETAKVLTFSKVKTYDSFFAIVKGKAKRVPRQGALQIGGQLAPARIVFLSGHSSGQS
jgi:hypothetical protein